jgi:hypothetical protein
MTRSHIKTKCKSSKVSKACSPKIWATVQHNQAKMASPQEKVEKGSTPLARNQSQIRSKDNNGAKSNDRPSRKRQMAQHN